MEDVAGGALAGDATAWWRVFFVEMLPLGLVSLAFMGLAARSALHHAASGSGMSGFRRVVLVAAAQPLLFLLLFVSLALHMRTSLGAWPETIGMHGFPDALRMHANVALWLFGSLMIGVILFPAALGACALVPKLRNGLRGVLAWAGCTLLAWGLMSLAPTEFLYWWWD